MAVNRLMGGSNGDEKGSQRAPKKIKIINK